jgi:hypothetical protein
MWQCVGSTPPALPPTIHASFLPYTPCNTKEPCKQKLNSESAVNLRSPDALKSRTIAQRGQHVDEWTHPFGPRSNSSTTSSTEMRSRISEDGSYTNSSAAGSAQRAESGCGLGEGVILKHTRKVHKLYARASSKPTNRTQVENVHCPATCVTVLLYRVAVRGLAAACGTNDKLRELHQLPAASKHLQSASFKRQSYVHNYHQILAAFRRTSVWLRTVSCFPRPTESCSQTARWTSRHVVSENSYQVRFYSLAERNDLPLSSLFRKLNARSTREFRWKETSGFL